MTYAVELVGVTKSYGSARAAAGVDLTLAPGEVLAVIGPSGCGKSSLLRLVAGLERPDEGRIEIAGVEVAGPRGWVQPERRKVGLVFQDHALFPHLDVRRNVGFGLNRTPRATREQRVATMLEQVHLGSLAARYPHQLSGGEQQRVALARALAPEPEVVLMDEPFSSLDEHLRTRVRGELMSAVRASGTTTIVVTHDQTEALAIADRVAVMRAGRVEQIGTPVEVFEQPASRFVATFMGDASFLPAHYDGAGMVCELGVVPGADLPQERAYDVVIRPHEVGLVADQHGEGEVVAVEYHGSQTLHDVRLGSGVRVRSWQPHNARHPVGTRVNAYLLPGLVPALLPAEDARVVNPRVAAGVALPD